MEEKHLSSEQTEEVIELFDIVGQSESGEPSEQAEESRDTEESGNTDRNSESSSDDNNALTRLAASASDEETSVAGEDAVDTDVTSSADSATGEIADTAALPVKPSSAGASESSSACTEDEASECLEQEVPDGMQSLKDRVAALEKANRALAEEVESLSQQLAQVGTMFLDDASVRLAMEEMVSRMLDVRLPVPAEQESDSTSLDSRVSALEQRMQNWDSQSEQAAAAAAARVIRQEIAAMKAESAEATSL